MKNKLIITALLLFCMIQTKAQNSTTNSLIGTWHGVAHSVYNLESIQTNLDFERRSLESNPFNTKEIINKKLKQRENKETKYVNEWNRKASKYFLILKPDGTYVIDNKLTNKKFTGRWLVKDNAIFFKEDSTGKQHNGGELEHENNTITIKLPSNVYEDRKHEYNLKKIKN